MRPLLLLPLLVLGCADAPETPPSAPASVALTNRADSVAYRMVEASGGLDAWEALPVLRFEFGIERDGQQQVAARHYWDKRRNRYRVEWPGGEDTTLVAIFDAWPDRGRVFANGTELEGPAADRALATARRRTINDTYWLLAPLKLFDGGVERVFVPDSSDAATEAIRLSFENVGLTPGDRYWLFADRETGRLARWTFVLEGSPTPRSSRWTAYQRIEGPAGPVYLSARKEAVGAAGAVLTDGLQAPPSADSTLFSDPAPRL